MARLFAKIVDYPKLGSSVILLLSLLALGGYFRPNWPVDTWRAITSRPTEIQEKIGTQEKRRWSPAKSVERSSLGRADAYLVVQSDQIFTREGAAALRDIVAALRDQPTIASVQWLDEAPPLNIFGLAEPILPLGHASPQRFAMAKTKALKHPLVVGLFLSSDAKTLLISLRFNWVFLTADADCTTRILDTAKATLAKHDSVKMDFALTGNIPIQLAIRDNQASNEVHFQLIGYGMILVMAIILFRGLTVVCVVAAAPAIGVFWSLGFLRYFGWHDNPFSLVILPVLLSLVGFADGVHLMVYIRQCLSDGLQPKPACRNALATVGVACSITTITTSIGMGSLAFSRNDIVREFAYSCVMGSVTILAAVLLVIPLACSSRLGRRLAKGANRGIVDRYLQHIGEPVMSVVRYARPVAYLAIACLIVLGACTLQLRPDDRLSNALPSGSDAQKALALLDASMGGLEVATVQIKWDTSLTEPRTIATIIDEIDRLLDQEPLLAHPLSLCRLLAALPGDESPIDKMPMAELLPPPLKLALYDPESQQATITFRVQDRGTATYKPTFERLERGLQELEKKYVDIRCYMSGGAINRWKNLYKIVSDLATSLGTASIEILIVMGIAFRSLRLGLIAIIPNMVPLAASGTIMAILGWPLDIVSVCSFTVCLGIAVDDTIHFLSRYREELTHQPNRRLAIQQAFQGVGTGMIMTTIVLIAGFSSVLTSQTRDHRVFAVLGIITLVSALLCDLFLLPSLLAHFDKPKKEKASRGRIPE